LGKFFFNFRSIRNFRATFPRLQLCINYNKISWAAVWATFSPTHLVTLITTKFSKNSRLLCNTLFHEVALWPSLPAARFNRSTNITEPRNWGKKSSRMNETGAQISLYTKSNQRSIFKWNVSKLHFSYSKS
jgi:hypothetical protein